MVNVEIYCTTCDIRNIVVIEHIDDYYRWKRGMPIQKAFPYLSVSNRELLMTATCDDCWSDMFGVEP